MWRHWHQLRIRLLQSLYTYQVNSTRLRGKLYLKGCGHQAQRSNFKASVYDWYFWGWQQKPLEPQKGWRTSWCSHLHPVLELQKATSTVIIYQMLSSSRKSLRTQITERTQSGSPHGQSFGSAVWIHKEAPGNGFLMGSWQDWWADRRYVKYLLFWLLLELRPYLKQGPNEGHFGGDYSPAALHEVRLGIKAPRWSA